MRAKYITDRLKENTTWVSIIGVATGLGIVFTDLQTEVITSIGVLLACMVGAFMPNAVTKCGRTGKEYIIGRLKENTTWMSITGALTVAGVTLSPEQATSIATIGATLASIIGITMPNDMDTE